MIEGNHIEGMGREFGISISNAEDVTIRGNQIAQCQPGIKVQYSRRVSIDNGNVDVSVGPGVSDLENTSQEM
jgi:parallel beta-helix repeat protein